VIFQSKSYSHKLPHNKLCTYTAELLELALQYIRKSWKQFWCNILLDSQPYHHW